MQWKRMYSPTLGRFMQTDPIGYGDGMNMYGYVGNDPVNFIDPSGLLNWPSNYPSRQNGKEICDDPCIVTAPLLEELVPPMQRLRLAAFVAVAEKPEEALAVVEAPPPKARKSLSRQLSRRRRKACLITRETPFVLCRLSKLAAEPMPILA
jgi:hypothetical protein